jgi:hypothetical protein
MSEMEKQFYLRNEIKSLLKWTKQGVQTQVAIVEKCLLILWRHIEFYLAYFETSSDGYQLYKNDLASGASETAIQNDYQTFKQMNSGDSLLKKTELSKEDFARFRQDLIVALNAGFLKRFAVVEKVNCRSINNLFFSFLFYAKLKLN